MSGEAVGGAELAGTLMVEDESLAVRLRDAGYRVVLVLPREGGTR